MRVRTTFILFSCTQIMYKVRHIAGFPQTFLNEGGHKTSLWRVLLCIFPGDVEKKRERSVSLCVCVWYVCCSFACMYVCIYTCMCMHVKVIAWHQRSSSTLYTIFFWGRVFTEPGYHPIGHAGVSASPRDPPIFASSVLWLQGTTAIPDFWEIGAQSLILTWQSFNGLSPLHSL